MNAIYKLSFAPSLDMLYGLFFANIQMFVLFLPHSSTTNFQVTNRSDVSTGFVFYSWGAVSAGKKYTASNWKVIGVSPYFILDITS